MRYDKLVRFYDLDRNTYDPDTGTMEPKETDIGQRYCSVNDLRADRQMELFGRLDVGAIAIHHQGKPIDAQMVEVDEKPYHITSRRSLRSKATYIATEAKL